MKFTSVFLLFIFSCVVFYVGPVSSVFAIADHDADAAGYYAAEAHAYRYGGHNRHVRLDGKVTSAEQGRNVYYAINHYKANNLGGVTKLKGISDGPLDGSFHIELDERYMNLLVTCVVVSRVEGDDRLII